MRITLDRGTTGDAAPGALVAVGLVVTAFARIGPGPAVPVRTADIGTVALATAVGVAVAVRRRHPVTALVALNALCLAWFAIAGPGLLIGLTPLIGCYTLAVQRGWRWAMAAAATTALVGIVGVRFVLGDTGTVGVVPAAVLLAATAGSAGAAVGYYRALLALTRAELARETRGREERARRVAAEERLRIARELHDVIGHTMATISVQAGVGLHVPDQAGQALTAIKTIADDGLADVTSILDILRTDEKGTRTPRGGLDRLPDLIDTAEAGGLHVELEMAGDRSLPAPVDLAAYRIIQEALTNVLRHAHARTVRLKVTHEPSRVVLRVRDDGRATGAEVPDGHGIDGMRERARALSGRLTAAPHPDGGFEVRAELPVPVLPR